MNFTATLCSAMLAFAPIALARGNDTNRTGQTMDEGGQKGDYHPATGSKESGGAGNAEVQDGLPSPNRLGHGSSSGDSKGQDQ